MRCACCAAGSIVSCPPANTPIQGRAGMCPGRRCSFKTIQITTKALRHQDSEAFGSLVSWCLGGKSLHLYKRGEVCEGVALLERRPLIFIVDSLSWACYSVRRC